MKSNLNKTKHVHSDKQSETLAIRKPKKWYPINFQLIPVLKLNNELNLKTNTMKTLKFLPIFILLMLSTSCSTDDDTLFGSGVLTAETRSVNFFEKVSSEGVFEVIITQGTYQSVEVTADDNIIGQIKTRVFNDELELYLDDAYNYRNITIRVTIVTTSLNSVSNSGTGNMSIYDIEENGTFTIDNSGTGDIAINGITNNFKITNEGTGDIYGFDFFTENCTIGIQGSGSVEVSCSNLLEVDIEGSGNVYYKGNPTTDISIEGSGNVINSN